MTHDHVKIAPGDYPQVPATQSLIRMMQQNEVLAAAERALKESEAILRHEVERYLAAMLAAGEYCNDRDLYCTAHELRGLAGNAGLPAAAAIANSLCHYLDTLQRTELSADHTVVALHMDALMRAVRAEDDATRLGDAVTQSLEALVAKKLTEINTSESKRDGSTA